MADGYHVPVMVEEVLVYLEPERGGTYFDGTVGGGGHAAAILRAGGAARVIGADRDTEALAEVERRLSSHRGRLTLMHGDYADVAERLGEALAGALLDLGVSSRQLDSTERGFSFQEGTALDMRMDPESGAPTAAELLNTLDESALADVFRAYGEERRSSALARVIVERRSGRPFETSEDLVSAMRRVLGPGMDAQDKARIFQALRIAVNEELESLERALPALRDRLEPGGVLVVLAYHSLEDRVVKHTIREWSRSCVCPPGLPVCACRGEPLGEVLTSKPVRASDSEVKSNPRARSARLRAWRKAA